MFSPAKVHQFKERQTNKVQTNIFSGWKNKQITAWEKSSINTKSLARNHFAPDSLKKQLILFL